MAVALLLVACTGAPPRLDDPLPPLPEGASGYTAKPGWAFKRMAVAAANPLASEAGLRVLQAGGNAMAASAPRGGGGILDMITPMLDRDGDGSAADDVLGFVSNMFRK